MLFKTVEGYFSTDIKIAGLLFLAMKEAVVSFEELRQKPSYRPEPFQVIRLHLHTNSGPDYHSTLHSWSNCKDSLTMVTLFGSPKDLTQTKKSLKFASGTRAWEDEVVEEVKSGSSKSLAKDLRRIKQEVTQDKNVITVLSVHLIDTYKWREKLETFDSSISFTLLCHCRRR